MEKKLGESKVTRRYQVTIPKTVRVFLEIKEGDMVVFVLKDGEIVVRKG
ncbi:MAG: AbrB family transcriptional regulator [Desulfurococcales archaeon ex4484_58]|nr:MAG: AbrB family transcriptional regulator [Desulfurococcales archaeon ex4484_58]